jgi:hypothetical protein
VRRSSQRLDIGESAVKALGALEALTATTHHNDPRCWHSVFDYVQVEDSKDVWGEGGWAEGRGNSG